MRVLFVIEYLPQEMLGVMWLSRAIKDAGHECRALFLPDSDWLRKAREFAPDVLAYSLTTGMHRYALEINSRLKQVLPDALSLFGGPHPTFTPEFVEEDDVDVICRGEGEEAIVDLLDRMRDGRDFRDTLNLWVKDRETGEVHKNPQRPLIQDLDSLGFPDRDVIYEAAPIYRDSDRKVFTSQRGCPMNCSFCFHHAWKTKIYGVNNKEYTRKRSVSHVIDEINDVRKRYNLKFVHFVDDIFNVRNDWLKEFAERYPREVGLPFDVILMANMTTERHIELLAQAGCVYARIAFEAASDHIRNAVFKKNTTRKQLTEAAGWIRKHGIRLGSLNILGAPGATLEDELDTIRLNAECKVEHPMVSLLQPYPMFDITDQSNQMGYAVSSLDEFQVNFRRTAPLALVEKHKTENLHKLFPLAVRNPWLIRFLPRLISWRWMYRFYLLIFMLHAELLVSEQAGIYARAQSLRGPRYWTWVDFFARVFKKGLLRTWQIAFEKRLELFGSSARKLKLSLQMGDERVIAHMD